MEFHLNSICSSSFLTPDIINPFNFSHSGEWVVVYPGFHKITITSCDVFICLFHMLISLCMWLLAIWMSYLKRTSCLALDPPIQGCLTYFIDHPCGGNILVLSPEIPLLNSTLTPQRALWWLWQGYVAWAPSTESFISSSAPNPLSFLSAQAHFMIWPIIFILTIPVDIQATHSLMYLKNCTTSFLSPPHTPPCPSYT